MRGKLLILVNAFYLFRYYLPLKEEVIALRSKILCYFFHQMMCCVKLGCKRLIDSGEDFLNECIFAFSLLCPSGKGSS